MDRQAAEKMARELMDAHELTHVPFRFNRKKRTFGITYFKGLEVKRIELSALLVDVNNEEQVRDTMLHEIAHAKVGIEARHGWKWRAMARELGADTSRKCGSATMVPGSWSARCSCMVHYMYRKPRVGKICRFCRERLTYWPSAEKF